jgi:NAD(P)-dependent dehydrogenase (short-subunit alcohol dehydrogenase family)
MNDSGIAGRHAFVTGGARGIGAAIAADLARSGARVSLTGRDPAALESQAQALRAASGASIEWFVLDVADESQVASAIAAARERQGDIEILVNNAGIAKGAPLAEMSLELWNRHLAVNLTGAFLCARAVLPDMIQAGYGRIVNIASIAALKGMSRVAAYAASKHGLVGLTRSLALEVAKQGVTVNAVCPGYTDTAMAEGAIEAVMKVTGRDREDAERRITRISPLGRLVLPAEVAAAVLFLCSDAAAAITGEALVIGGEVA